jgi:phage terminase small subunit
MDELTDKQRLFVEHYLACWNATEAARRAGYDGTEGSLRSIGSENLTKPNIEKEIAVRIAEKAMTANEVLVSVGGLARFDVSPFIRFNGRSKTPYVDVKALIAAGYGYAIKSVVKTKFGTNIEFYDRFAALQLIGKHFKLFAENHNHAIGNKDNKPFVVEVKAIDYRTAIAPLAPGPVADSNPSGEGQSSVDGEAMG